jgi:hypothetical protein
MGKRELLLIVAFAIAGAIVYQVTAPPPAPGERSFSPGRILDNIRREIRGNRASAEAVNTSTYPVEAATTELRLIRRPGELTIIGEDRADISAELKVRSNAYDDAEAQRTAKATMLKMDGAGARIVATMSYPEEGRQTATLTLRVPSRLEVKLDSGGGRTRIENVAGAEMSSGRGDAEITRIRGRVAGDYRGGKLRVLEAGSIKLTTVGTDLRLEHISGETTLNLRAGEFKGSDLRGPVDLDATGVDIELEQLEKATGILRITASAGSISLKGLRTEGRIDARNSEVDAVIDRAAPLAIYSEGGSPVSLTPPSGGYELDAVASDGSITLPEGTLQVASNGSERRATGPVNGGGPMVTIRTTHGSITLRER